MRYATESSGGWKGVQKALLKMVSELRTDCKVDLHRLRRERPLQRQGIDEISVMMRFRTC